VLYASLRRIIGRPVDRFLFKLDYEQDRSLAALEAWLRPAPTTGGRAARFVAGTLAPTPATVLLSGRARSRLLHAAPGRARRCWIGLRPQPW
jgi:hypothetical protein